MSVLIAPKYPWKTPGGKLIEPGTLRKSVEWDPLMDTELPSWLSIISPANSSFVTAATGLPGLRLAPPSGTFNGLSMPGGILASVTSLAAISLEIRGLSTIDDCISNQVALALADSTSVTGIRTTHPLNGNAADVNATVCDEVHTLSPSSTYTTSYKASTIWNQPVNGVAPSPTRQMNGVNLGLMVNFNTEQVHLFEGRLYEDADCVAAIDATGKLGRGPGDNTSKIIPRVLFYGTAGRYFHIGGFKVTTWYN